MHSPSSGRRSHSASTHNNSLVVYHPSSSSNGGRGVRSRMRSFFSGSHSSSSHHGSPSISSIYPSHNSRDHSLAPNYYSQAIPPYISSNPGYQDWASSSSSYYGGPPQSTHANSMVPYRSSSVPSYSQHSGGGYGPVIPSYAPGGLATIPESPYSNNSISQLGSHGGGQVQYPMQMSVAQPLFGYGMGGQPIPQPREQHYWAQTEAPNGYKQTIYSLTRY